MKISEKWLREWVNPNLPVTALADQLTLMGLTVDSVSDVASDFTKVIVGEVIATRPHPDATKLTCCQVDIGESEPLSIVCGATNVRAGIKVPVATVGAVLPGDFKIKKAKLRGEPSEGMICSANELGLKAWQAGVEGIMELPADAPVGEDFRTYFQADDHMIDIEITPNRGDCLSVRGIARDLAAMNHLHLRHALIEMVPAEFPNEMPVLVAASEACPRYVGRVIKGINNTIETPSWIQIRLQRSGIRPINLVVDICNYVMLEIGQPMHAFDLSKIPGAICVRYAKDGEKCQLLNDEEITLSTDDLVIADRDHVLALAGVMGGSSSSVTTATTDIFLEAAFFTPKTVCLSARRYGMSTDSSYRFERGVDSTLQVDAIERATTLLLEIGAGSPAEIIEKVAENFLPEKNVIVLRRAAIERLLGMTILDQTVFDILTRLGMAVKKLHDGWEVVSPSYRFDITAEIDLIEELVRMVGYNNIHPSKMMAPLTMQAQSELELSDARIRACLIDRGYFEAITYSFIDPKIHQLFSQDADPIVLDNPLSADLSVMRGSLLPGLLLALARNMRHQINRVRLFETGLCFKREKQLEKTLQQTPMCAVVATGYVLPEQWGSEKKSVDFYDVKADIEALLALSHHADHYEWRPLQDPILHPGRSAGLYINDTFVGKLGELHPAVKQALDLKQAVMVGEFSLTVLKQAASLHFRSFSKFPAVRRDLALVIDKSVTSVDITRVITKSASDALQSIQVFDVYEGAGVENGKKSIALGLTFQDASRTLRDEEINEIIQGVVAMLEKDLKATLRAG